MGLFNRRHYGLNDLAAGAANWQVAAVLVAACIIVGLFGDAGRELLKYDRIAIGNGEYWRLLTGHFTHLGTTHLALNLTGLVLVWLLVGRYFSTIQWVLVVGLSIVAVSGGFWFFDRYMLWYVGLSGALHGLLLAGAIEGYKSLPVESVLIVVIVAGKLAYEQFAGPVPGSESVSGGDVVVNAHLFGGIGGVVAAAILWRRGDDKPSI